MHDFNRKKIGKNIFMPQIFTINCIINNIYSTYFKVRIIYEKDKVWSSECFLNIFWKISTFSRISDSFTLLSIFSIQAALAWKSLWKWHWSSAVHNFIYLLTCTVNFKLIYCFPYAWRLCDEISIFLLALKVKLSHKLCMISIKKKN